MRPIYGTGIAIFSSSGLPGAGTFAILSDLSYRRVQTANPSYYREPGLWKVDCPFCQAPGGCVLYYTHTVFPEFFFNIIIFVLILTVITTVKYIYHANWAIFSSSGFIPGAGRCVPICIMPLEIFYWSNNNYCSPPL